jgi:asparagine synthetase B (glutamine-hydrolysing)
MTAPPPTADPPAPGSGARPTTLSSLEVASGLVLEERRVRGRLVGLGPVVAPRAALEAAVLPALRRGPCLASFSGGRDSSAILALATAVARREGLPAPIPATQRFARAAASQESEWQEQVVAHLGLEDWMRIDLDGELDCVGPVAERALRRHGLLWPSNAHFHAPILEAAAGGSVLTGIGGDEALSPSRARLALAAVPRPLRRRLLARRLPEIGAWLRPAARDAVHDALAAEAAHEPLRWAAWYDWLAGARYLDVGLGALALLAADHRAEIHHPFFDHGFLAAVAALPRAHRFETRTDAMHALVGDLLPPALLARATKAHFDDAFWTDHSRDLVERWTGEGVDDALVDPERLRDEWRSPAPDPRSVTLLQSVLLLAPPAST